MKYYKNIYKNYISKLYLLELIADNILKNKPKLSYSDLKYKTEGLLSDTWQQWCLYCKFYSYGILSWFSWEKWNNL